jgi:hypothetical protein
MPLQVAKQDISKPTQLSITYGGEYDGQLSSFNKKTGQGKDISPYPESNIGSFGAKNTVFNGRTQLFSPHNPKKNVVLRLW